MAEASQLPIVPRYSLGTFTLGASIHDILARIKAQPLVYPSIQLSYSQTHPLLAPIVVRLSHNGLRLRFDGPEQRLRLVEVLDFSKSQLSYKDHEISGPVDRAATSLVLDKSGPTFRQVFKIFGPTTPGEYIAPLREGEEVPAEERSGIYVLSYPGIAFSFPLQEGTWNSDTTWASTVSLLSSTAAGASTALSVFNGESWSAVRDVLFTADMTGFLRSPLALGVKRETAPREIEFARVKDRGRVELVRADTTSFWIVAGETTPQDLVTELGPPDSIHRKNDRRVSIHRRSDARKGSSTSRRGSSNVDLSQSPPSRDARGNVFVDSEASSQGDESDASDDDVDVVEGEAERKEVEQVFYNYYSHGFDILISTPTAPSAGFPGSKDAAAPEPVIPRSHLTATKILFHGNVPGSWPFNRHRRLRWIIDDVPSTNGDSNSSLTSETLFPVIQQQLSALFRDSYATPSEERAASLPMAVNRGWGRDELGGEGGEWGVVGSWEDANVTMGTKKGAKGDEETPAEKMGGAEVYGFPGLVFEVLKNGAVSCLMVH